MKSSGVLAVAIVLGWLGLAQAQVSVDPYLRKDGSYTGGHSRSNPDGNPYNNWSHPGNVNLYTGRKATGDPNKYLERYDQRGNSGSTGSGNNPSYNPYTIYRR